MPGLLLALLAAHDQQVTYVPGRTVNTMAGAYRGESQGRRAGRLFPALERACDYADSRGALILLTGYQAPAAIRRIGQARIKGLEARITATFRAHPQVEIIESMPGMGPIPGTPDDAPGTCTADASTCSGPTRTPVSMCPGSAGRVCDALIPAIDVYSLNEDEMEGRLDRSVIESQAGPSVSCLGNGKVPLTAID